MLTKLPSWEDARSLLHQFKGHALMTVAAKVCLGLTLQQLKEKEGYTQGKKPQAAVISTQYQTWEEHVTAELGISADTATRFIRAGYAVREKLKKIGGSPHLLSLLEQPVQTLSQADAAAVQEAIRTSTDGESITSLLQEFYLIKRPPQAPADPAAGGKAPRTPQTEEQLAWDFAGGDVITQLNRVRTGSKFSHALHSMPLSKTDTTPFGLYDYVTELRETLKTAEAVLEARTKS